MSYILLYDQGAHFYVRLIVESKLETDSLDLVALPTSGHVAIGHDKQLRPATCALMERSDHEIGLCLT